MSFPFECRCAIKSSKFPSCQAPNATVTTNSSQANVSARDLLLGLDPNEPSDLPNPIWFNTVCLLLYIVVFRFLGYLVLRTKRKA